MADEEFYDEQDNNDLDLDLEEPEPQQFDISHEHASRFSINDADELIGGHDDNVDDEDNNDDDNNVNRGRYFTNQQIEMLVGEYKRMINEVQAELDQSHNENSIIQQNKERTVIEYDSKMEELQMEIDQLQIESQQYQIRYQEKNDELNEVRFQNNEFQNSDKEKQEIYIKLQNMEQNEMSFIIELEQTVKQLETLRNQNKTLNDNNIKLQKSLIILKKEKIKTEKLSNKTVGRLDSLQQQYEMEKKQLSSRLMQLQTENEIYKQNLSKAEQEKMEMHNNFTEATMELLHDELNDANSDNGDEPEHFRLGSIDAKDLEYNNDNNQNEPLTPVLTSAFIKHRFGSQVSLPDHSLLDSFEDIPGHSRQGSYNSQYGGGGQGIDHQKLKQDIRNILIEDIKGIISLEVTNNQNKQNNNQNIDNNLLTKIEELLANPKNNNNNNNSGGIDKNMLNEVLMEFRLSIEDILQKNNETNQNDNIQKIQNEIKENLNQLLLQKKTKNADDDDNKDDDSHETSAELFKEVISSSMTNLQIALENQLENQLSSTIDKSVGSIINKQRNEIKEDIKDELSEIKTNILSLSNDNKNNNFLDKLNENFEKLVENSMGGKIDSFMDDFRSEVIPEIKAVFDKLSVDYIGQNNQQNDEEKDDEKAQNVDNETRKQEHSLLSTIDDLRQEINKLKEDKEEFNKTLKECATSKIHQIVKLQNLIDHQRNDNRILQHRLDAYIKKFNQIKETQEKTVVNKLWAITTGWNGGNRNNNFST